ncbi:MAG: hypothetical protein ACFHWZ_04235 [Phycisphaerales bacterium]
MICALDDRSPNSLPRSIRSAYAGFRAFERLSVSDDADADVEFLKILEASDLWLGRHVRSKTKIARPRCRAG